MRTCYLFLADSPLVQKSLVPVDNIDSFAICGSQIHVSIFAAEEDIARSVGSSVTLTTKICNLNLRNRVAILSIIIVADLNRANVGIYDPFRLPSVFE